MSGVTTFQTGLKSREHRGGACPCHELAIVRVCLRGPGWTRHEIEAGKLRWKHRDDAGDIVRYAVVSTPEEADENTWNAKSGGY